MENGKNRILLVDDEKATLLGLGKMLSTAEIMVDTAETLEEALLLIREKPFDVIISDLRLTGIFGEEGLEIARTVKRQGLPSKVILITGYGNPEIKKKALSTGVDYYFEKPVSWTVLKGALSELGLSYEPF